MRFNLVEVRNNPNLEEYTATADNGSKVMTFTLLLFKRKFGSVIVEVLQDTTQVIRCSADSLDEAYQIAYAAMENHTSY